MPRNRHTHRLSGFEVDHQLELGWLLNWYVGYFGTPEQFVDLLRHHLCEEPTKTRSVGGEVGFLRLLGPSGIVGRCSAAARSIMS